MSSTGWITVSSSGFNSARFGRLLVLIAFVSALFILTAAETLDGNLFQIAVFAIGAVSLLTAMTGFIIAASVALDAEAT